MRQHKHIFYFTSGILTLFALCCIILFAKKINSTAPSTSQHYVIAYQCELQDSFRFQHRILNLPIALQPQQKINIALTHQLLAYPQFLPDTISNNAYANQTIHLEKDSNLRPSLRRITHAVYNAQGLLDNYMAQSRNDYYTATYVYNQQQQVEMIVERFKKWTLHYNSHGHIDTMLQYDKANTLIKKVWIEE